MIKYTVENDGTIDTYESEAVFIVGVTLDEKDGASMTTVMAGEGRDNTIIAFGAGAAHLIEELDRRLAGPAKAKAYFLMGFAPRQWNRVSKSFKARAFRFLARLLGHDVNAEEIELRKEEQK